MVEITDSSDCGNSPKNRFAQDVAVALETGNPPTDMLSERVIWFRLHHDAVKGREAVLQAIREQPEVSSIVIEHAISHGRVGMANGLVIFTDGARKRFCHVLDFTNTKGNCVAAINSYG
ncbi:hypothetical protein [Sphingobium sp. CFD-2]|uniref:hypothetical protein n=1 Tax=Sphingobium sp. CFD-2 TaxID=2878542 RepID=UPI00214C6C0B|nr:hypothetical protein [Sphingobium sp. CFD-2]